MSNLNSSITAFGKPVQNIEQLIDIMCDEVEARIGTPLCDIASPARRVDAVRQLDDFGIFSMRYAAIRVAKRMMVSKVTLYGMLKETRND